MVHDIYPDLLVKLGKGTEKNLLIRCWRLLNRFSYEKAEVVMTLGKHMASTLAKSFDPERTSHGRIETFYPWADTELLKPLPKADNWFAKQHDQLNKLTVMYSGNMGIGHDIETMLEVAVELKDKPNVHFMFIGDGPKWQLVHTVVREKRLSNITVLGWQTEKVVPFSLATADIAFVSLEEGLAGLAIPSKSFSFLAVGVPLLVISSENTELSDIISQYKCGWILRPKDAKTMRSLCETLDEGDDLQRIKAQSREAAQAIGSRRNSVEMGALLASILIRPIVSFVAKTGIK
ncbi:MAG: glycosyltransferase family 4 protein [Verrucomicrobia bacterium]|nr:glycosyltransferase family 4 protein [Verrucomicrobiota bacterium]